MRLPEGRGMRHTVFLGMAVLAVAWLLLVWRSQQLLLAWYLHAIRSLELPQRPEEAIKTYPLY